MASPAQTPASADPAAPTKSTPSHERPIAPAPTRLYDSHQLNPDNSITFRLDAPHAQRVDLVTDISGAVLPLTRNDEGLWTVTTSPLPPALYAYAFSVDGVDQADPRNPLLKPNLVSNASMVLVPGTPAQPWEPVAVPHGTVHSHVYTTAAVEGLPANQSRYLVYTPPDYASQPKTLYPVLYLLHGWSDWEASWIQTGQAHFIFDALIASGTASGITAGIDAGKAKPMVVVMPLCYGQMSFVESGFGVWQDPAAVLENVRHFQRALLDEILPQVEAGYNVRRDREGRAIAGISMGGLESLLIGLSHMDRFAWIGGFSSALTHFEQQAPGLLPGLKTETAKLRLLWLACGAEDPLLTANRKSIAWLRQQGLAVTAVETPGGHAWPVWRNNLIQFAPLLF
jgi:enterochelin esterase-like enzyme